MKKEFMINQNCLKFFYTSIIQYPNEKTNKFIIGGYIEVWCSTNPYLFPVCEFAFTEDEL